MSSCQQPVFPQSAKKSDVPIQLARLVKWTQENMVGGSKVELQKTLELCTQELLKLNRYASDVRFLRLWVQYVSAITV